MTTAQIRAVWSEALNDADNEAASLMAWEAGDNAALTCQDNGQPVHDAAGNHSDEFLYWWEQSVISLLSHSSYEFNTEAAKAYYAQRGITA
jgi:hypothetical protein